MIAPPLSLSNFFFKHEIIRLLQFFPSKLTFWALVRPEYSPFLGRPETQIYETLAWNRLEGLRGLLPWLSNEENYMKLRYKLHSLRVYKLILVVEIKCSIHSTYHNFCFRKINNNKEFKKLIWYT